MDLENDLELERCDEEIRRLDERRKKVLERKNRRMRQIREKQLKDREAWIKRIIPLFDKTLQEKLGALYWYGYSVEEICEGVKHMKLPVSPDYAADTGGTEPAEEDSGNNLAAHREHLSAVKEAGNNIED